MTTKYSTFWGLSYTTRVTIALSFFQFTHLYVVCTDITISDRGHGSRRPVE